MITPARGARPVTVTRGRVHPVESYPGVVTREPETHDDVTLPTADALPDRLDLLAEPLRMPARGVDSAGRPTTGAPRTGAAGTGGAGASRAQTGTAEASTAETGTADGGTVGTSAADTTEPVDPPPGPARPDAAEHHAARPDTAEHPAAQHHPAQPETAQHHPARPDAAEHHPTQPDAAERDPAAAPGPVPAPRTVDEAGADRRPGAGPSVPARPWEARPPSWAPRDADAPEQVVAHGSAPHTAGPPAPPRPAVPPREEPAHHAGGSHAAARPSAWAPPVAGTPTAPPARHRRQPWGVIVLTTLFALTLALATYLVVLTRAHEERAADWERLARTTGTELAQQRAELDGALAELEAVRSQLQTAQARITELADEKAQIGDEREAQRQLVDYQARVSDAAGKVAGALDTCVDGQYQLIGYLENSAAYDAADLARFRTSVQTVCGDARDANAALQRELER